MLDEDQGLYTIGTVAELIEEHPETLRVWERNNLIHPERKGRQRRYSNNDIKRLQFIKYLIDQKGLNIAGARHIISMYSCWYNRNCKGGAYRNSPISVNESKACWKIQNTFCLIASDKAEMCNSCALLKSCQAGEECNIKDNG
ncbi:putative heat shock protein HspR [Desulfosporosinus acididurans]|uniref:Putative heat shock protein HspR n=1 Tax=Desulfosporosinus acididurans TaxID=476652 RepID=A0A0J1FRT1_9FIRM|nr:MerR family transcriptional regulator [Desulfosporosinus acididurans]KLU66190.1 putative heat shock protein HspR [Desulfosporosinus acididurans]